MKKEYFLETAEATKALWQKLISLSDEEIDAQIADNEDAQTPEHGAGGWLGREAINAQNPIILQLAVDRQTANFINEYHVDYQVFLVGVLKTYVENQGKM